MNNVRGDKKIILIVEDDLFLGKAYRIKLEAQGDEVWVAGDGNEAISFMERGVPDLVLLDLMLPGVSGFDVLAAYRKNEKWKKVPIFILSNLGQEQDIEKGMRLGANEYIVKANSKLQDVINKVNSYLKRDN